MRLSVFSLSAVFVVAAAAGCTSSGEAGHARPTARIHASQSPHPASRTTPKADASTSHARCFRKKATIVGTSGADHLVATPKTDVIVGLGGDDVVDDVGGQDLVCTGAGDDVVRSSRGGWALVLDLGPGNDRVHVRGAETINLGAGDDRARLTRGATVVGGPGGDRMVVGRGPATVSGGPGDDYLRALSFTWPGGYPENGACATYGSSPRSVHVDLRRGWAHGQGNDQLVGFDCVTGSHHPDVIRGSSGHDGIRSLGGDDLVYTGAGNDAVDAGNGADRVYLGRGRDYGLGNMGWDRLYGGPQADDLEGWFGGDYLEGDAGNDQLYAALYCSHGGNSYDTDGLLDSAGNELFGGSGDDYLVGDRGNDRLDGGPGDDWGMGGYHDGRADWIASMEHLVEGCLPNVDASKPFHPPS